MAPCHKKISGCKGKDSILTNHVCPVCSKDFVSSQGLTCHITSAPYCCNSWLSVSNGMPIDNFVLPANAASMFQDPSDHSVDDTDDDYHPIHATSTDGKDESAFDNDMWPTNDDMEENYCFDSHQESPSDVVEGDSGIDAIGDSSSLSHQVLPSLEPSSPGQNTNGHTFGPSKSFQATSKIFASLTLPTSYVRLVHHFLVLGKHWLGLAIGRCRVTFLGVQIFLHM